MKKLLFILITGLIVVYVLLAVISRDKGYEAEKLLYRAGTTYDKVRANPNVAPPGMITSVETDLLKVIKKYPDTKPAETAYMALAEVYMAEKAYDKAIEMLDEYIALNKDNIANVSKAYFLKGLAYERSDRWNQAVKVFNDLKEKYINTSLGLQVPYYIASYYRRHRQQAEADRALDEAVRFYRGIGEKYDNTTLGYAASNFQILCLMDLNRYEEAGGVVEKLLKGYPLKITFLHQLPYIELIYVKNLKRPEKAIELYRYVKTKTDNEKLLAVLDEKIGQLAEKGSK